MDTRHTGEQYISSHLRARERGYIWLERELKRMLLVSTAVVTVFFAVLFFALKPDLAAWAVSLFSALALDAAWVYVNYRREYRNYQAIYRYLEEFETGNYAYRGREDFAGTGIRAQLAEQLARMGEAFGGLKEKLVEEKENTKGLVTDISHQLKTPVAAVELSYELLQDASLDEKERKEFLKRGRGELRRLSQLVETLSNLSRLEADMIRLAPKEADLKETLIRAVNGVYMKAEKKEIEIELMDFDAVRLVHDVRWTAEAVSNVLDNAVKYSPGGTKIMIRVNIFASYVFIEVEDEGMGIPKSEYADIFKRFYRGRGAAVLREEGAGVGLYLVRKILEEQGGSVRAIKAPGGGTIMQMMLPKKYEV